MPNLFFTWSILNILKGYFILNIMPEINTTKGIVNGKVGAQGCPFRYAQEIGKSVSV